MIPVFNHSDIEVAKAVLDACYVGGVRVFEFTNRSENSLSVFKSLKKHSAKYPDLFLGIGTVFSVVDADEFLDAGGDFIVSPSLLGLVSVSIALFSSDCRKRQ